MAAKKTTTKKSASKTTTTRRTTKQTAKPAASKRVTNTDAKPKRMSALDAAAQVLAKAKEPLGAKALIEAMAQQGLWSSPGGQTPHSTLYAAMIREIATKGTQARFKKVDRGQFTANR